MRWEGRTVNQEVLLITLQRARVLHGGQDDTIGEEKGRRSSAMHRQSHFDECGCYATSGKRSSHARRACRHRYPRSVAKLANAAVRQKITKQHVQGVCSVQQGTQPVPPSQPATGVCNWALHQQRAPILPPTSYKHGRHKRIMNENPSYLLNTRRTRHACSRYHRVDQGHQRSDRHLP